MASRPTFPLEKIFGSRTRVKIITLFTTGVKRPHYVREIARSVNERLNAVRRELEILEKIGMLESRENKRKKYYAVNPDFPLLAELSGIMQKAGPGVEDTLFKNVERIGDISYLCVSGFFAGAKDSPTDLLIVGRLHDDRVAAFVARVESQLEREVTYTPMTLNEFKYRMNFNDLFLKSIFEGPYKELMNTLPYELSPERLTEGSTAIVR